MPKSLYQRGKNRIWWVRFTAPNQTRVHESTGTRNKREAEEYLARLQAAHWREVRLGVQPEYTWEEAASRWLDETSHKATHDKDKEILKWVDPYLAGKRLTEINRGLLQSIANAKARETSKSTANRHMAQVRAILNRAANEWEWVAKAPKVPLFKVKKRRIRWITREEAERLLSCLPTHQAAMARFALATGLRQRNVCRMRWSQVDMQRHVAWVHPDESKNRKAIAVALNSEARHVLQQQIGQHEEYVFTFRGKPVWWVNTTTWREALRRAGLKDFRWHDLRHTCGRRLRAAGVPLGTRRVLLGHKNSDITTHYSAPEIAELIEAAECVCGKESRKTPELTILRVRESAVSG